MVTPVEQTPEKVEEVKNETAPKSHDDFVGKNTQLELELEKEEEEEKVESKTELEPEEKEEAETEEENPPHASLAELESGMRSLQAEISKLSDSLSERDRVLRENGLLEEVDPEELDRQQKAVALQENFLNNLYQVMSVNPNFPGFEEVLSVENQNAIIRDYGRAFASENGVSQTEAEQAVYRGIMAQPNPLLWYYEKITANYYESPKAEETVKKEVKTQTASIAPPSLGNASASLEVSGNNSWTMKRLDAMSESQLSQVPEEIRDKYLAGNLLAE
jgi:hypothetical protein